MSIEIKNLKKSFDDKIIFDGFTYSFPDKGIFALVGKSGIGKTTLLRLISGLDKDYSGEISITESSFSFAFQEYRLFPQLTALENVIFANFETNNTAEMEISKNTLLNLGFAEEELDLLPHELSGGMKQRVSLARAFVNSSKVLLLDEPTKELDANNAKRVRDTIIEEGKKRLVILVTHAPDEIDYLSATEIEFN